MLEALRGPLRKWLSCGRRRQPLPFGRRPASWLRRGPAHDVGLDQEVVSTTNHHKMFDIVAADEDDLSFSLDRRDSITATRVGASRSRKPCASSPQFGCAAEGPPRQPT